VSRYPTPSGLPPVEFREAPDLWQLGGSASSDLDAILRSGVWPPPHVTAIQALRMGRGIDVWVAAPRREHLGAFATISWWEARRPIFNGVLLSVCIPTVLLMLLVGLIRVWVFRIAGGSGPFQAPIDFTMMIGSVVLANVAYTVLCAIEILARAVSRPKTHIGLEMWQFCLIFSLVVIALSFFLSLPFALGLMYTVPL